MKRRAAAYQVYYENMPLRRTQRAVGPNLLLHRALAWGDLAVRRDEQGVVGARARRRVGEPLVHRRVVGPDPEHPLQRRDERGVVPRALEALGFWR